MGRLARTSFRWEPEERWLFSLRKRKPPRSDASPEDICVNMQSMKMHNPRKKVWPESPATKVPFTKNAISSTFSAGLSPPPTHPETSRVLRTRPLLIFRLLRGAELRNSGHSIHQREGILDTRRGLPIIAAHSISLNPRKNRVQRRSSPLGTRA